MGRLPAAGHGPKAHRPNELDVSLPVHDLIAGMWETDMGAHRARARWVDGRSWPGLNSMQRVNRSFRSFTNVGRHMRHQVMP